MYCDAGAGALPVLLGSMKETLPFVLLNLKAYCVRARFPSLVVYDVMVIVFSYMAS